MHPPGSVCGGARLNRLRRTAVPSLHPDDACVRPSATIGGLAGTAPTSRVPTAGEDRPLPARVPTRFRRRGADAVAEGRIFRYLAAATFVGSLAAGTAVWLIDRRDFATIGDGVWWAVQTLSTVGYGDIVPHTTWGRVIATAVIVLGVTFLSLLTATITSYFVSAGQDDRSAQTEELLRQTLARLDAIERRLDDRADRDGRS